ncbi:MAG: thioredoxin [Thioalkalivibrionaceae bacterium]
MAVTELNEQNFESTVVDNDIVVVDFWAPWCGPCRAFAPTFEEAAEHHKGIVFAKVNTEEEQGIAAAFQIRSIPTLMIFREKVIVFAQPGMLSASQLDQVIEQTKALDMEKVHKDVANQQENNA